MFGLFNKKVNLEQSPTANVIPLYSLKDKKLNTFGATIEAPNQEEWKKSYISLLRRADQKDNPIVAHAHDFDLYELGKVNKDTGTLIPHDSPLHCFCLEDLKTV